VAYIADKDTKAQIELKGLLSTGYHYITGCLGAYECLGVIEIMTLT
jgi:hypothetical protein